MKKLVCFLICIALFCGFSLFTSESMSRTVEAFGYFHETVLGAGASNQHIIPGFGAEKIYLQPVTGTTVTLTIYLRPNSGPLAATDSFTVTAITTHPYYGPTSDTMRVASDNAAYLAFYK